MKFNIYFTVRGPAKKAEIPNSMNPVEVDSLKKLLVALSSTMPESFFGAMVIGIRIEEAE